MALINVRPAVEDDLPAIFELGRELRAESPIPFPDADETVVRDTLALLGDFYFMAVAEVSLPEHTGGEKKIIGTLTAQLTRYAFSQEFMAQYDLFHVHREWRGSRAALLLIRAFENWAKEFNVGRAILGVHSGLDAERTGRFFEKLGYQPMGGNFMKEID